MQLFLTIKFSLYLFIDVAGLIFLYLKIPEHRITFFLKGTAYVLDVNAIYHSVLNNSQNYRHKPHPPILFFEGFRILPYGRFGNNVYQLLRILKYTEIFGFHRIVVPYNFLFLQRGFVTHNISFEIYNNFTDVSHLIYGEFYVPLKQVFVPMEFSYIYYFKSEVLKAIPILNLSKTDLYMHLRSGDVYNRAPHLNYGQPPVNYFLDTMKAENWTNIYLICEDNKSPIFPTLIKRGARHTNHTFLEDITTIINCHNLAIGKSTLGLSLSFLNRNSLKHFYTFNLPTYRILPHMNCEPDERFSNIILNKWKNLPSQRQVLLSSKCKSWKYFSMDPRIEPNITDFHYDLEFGFWFG